jgi:hypothetical protein
MLSGTPFNFKCLCCSTLHIVAFPSKFATKSRSSITRRNPPLSHLARLGLWRVCGKFILAVCRTDDCFVQFYGKGLLEADVWRAGEKAAQNAAVFVSCGGLPFLYEVAINIQGHGGIHVAETLLDRFEIFVLGNQHGR